MKPKAREEKYVKKGADRLDDKLASEYRNSQRASRCVRISKPSSAALQSSNTLELLDAVLLQTSLSCLLRDKTGRRHVQFVADMIAGAG